LGKKAIAVSGEAGDAPTPIFSAGTPISEAAAKIVNADPVMSNVTHDENSEPELHAPSTPDAPTPEAFAVSTLKLNGPR